MKPPTVVPRHVEACIHSPVRRERWSIWTWKKETVGQTQTRVPYQCNSWRCAVCRRYEAAVQFARMKQAAAPLDPRGWVLIVATLDREGFHTGERRWLNTDEAYADLGKMSRGLLDRVGREWGPETVLTGKKRKRTVRKLGNRWVGVVEAHRSGWPHMNLVVWCPELAALLRRERDERLADPEVANAVALARECWKNGEQVPAAVRDVARRARVISGRVREVLEAAGWGRESTAEPIDNVEAAFGYVVKLAGLHESSIGELAKFTQAPTNAKERFRRLRSGKGFLPPRVSNPDVTGCMVRRRRSREGDWDIIAVNAPKDERYIEACALARASELALIREEEGILSREGGNEVTAMPPMRHAFRGALEHHRDTSARNAERAAEAARAGPPARRGRKLARAG